MITVDRICHLSPDITTLLRNYPYAPYRRYRVIAAGTRNDFLNRQLAAFLSADTSAAVYIAARNRVAVGLTALSSLPEIERCFGVPAASLEQFIVHPAETQRHLIADALLQTTLRAAAQAGIRHLSGKIDTEDHTAIHAVERHGFHLMETMCTYVYNPRTQNFPWKKRGWNIRPVAERDVPAVLAIAGREFSATRFFRDQNFSAPDAARFYRQWAERCCRDTRTWRTLVAERNHAVEGFIAYRINKNLAEFCNISVCGSGLSAVSPAGKGAYPALLKAAQEDCADRGMELGEADTQIDNFAVNRICQRFGMELLKTRHTFHCWLPATGQHPDGRRDEIRCRPSIH